MFTGFVCPECGEILVHGVHSFEGHARGHWNVSASEIDRLRNTEARARYEKIMDAAQNDAIVGTGGIIEVIYIPTLQVWVPVPDETLRAAVGGALRTVADVRADLQGELEETYAKIVNVVDLTADVIGVRNSASFLQSHVDALEARIVALESIPEPEVIV